MNRRNLEISVEIKDKLSENCGRGVMLNKCWALYNLEWPPSYICSAPNGGRVAGEWKEGILSALF